MGVRDLSQRRPWVRGGRQAQLRGGCLQRGLATHLRRGRKTGPATRWTRPLCCFRTLALAATKIFKKISTRSMLSYCPKIRDVPAAIQKVRAPRKNLIGWPAFSEGRDNENGCDRAQSRVRLVRMSNANRPALDHPTRTLTGLTPFHFLLGLGQVDLDAAPNGQRAQTKFLSSTMRF